MTQGDDRPDPIAGILNETRAAEDRERQRDKRLGTQLYIGTSYLISAALIVVLAVTLVLPHSQGVLGIDVLFRTEIASQQQVSLPAFVFVLLYTVGTIGFGVVMIVTQKWWAAGIAWATSCIASVYGMLAIWLRQSGRGADPNALDFGAPSVGIYLAWITVLLLAIILAIVLWTKVPEQKELEKQTRTGGN